MNSLIRKLKYIRKLKFKNILKKLKSLNKRSMRQLNLHKTRISKLTNPKNKKP
jgi:hypothetical protein